LGDQLRRILAVAGAMFLGAVGTLALASPASAHSATLTYALKCGPEAGTATVVWSVKNNYGAPGTVEDLSRTLTGLHDQDEVTAWQSATGTEVVKIADQPKRLTLKMTWKDGAFDNAGERVRKSDLDRLGDCKPTPQPTADFKDNCDGTVTVTVTNPKEAPKTTFSVNGKGKFHQRFTLEPGQTSEPVVVPAANSEKIHVKVLASKDESDGNDDNDGFATHEFTPPAGCYEVSHKSTCDKLIISVKNTGTRSLSASVKVGDKEATTSIKAGDSDSIELDATEGLVATLTVEDKATEIKWEKPADCGNTLPLTGVNTGLLAGAAVVRVSGGASMYYRARRRRVLFAA
jgi:hypothetical protein